MTDTPRSDAHTEHRSLEGRRVLVTGGSTGIGRAVCVLLAEQGARIVTCARSEDPLRDALARIRDYDERALGLTADVSEAEDVSRLFGEASEHLGGLDAVVVNAGVPAGGLLDESEEDWRYAVATNFTGALAACAEAGTRMKGAGGDVVITGSMSAHRPGGGSSVYAATKAGLHAFAEAFRQEMGEHGVKVSIIEPGKTGADLFEHMDDAEMREHIVKEEMLRAEDVAVGVAYVLTQPTRCVVSGLRLEPRLHV